MTQKTVLSSVSHDVWTFTAENRVFGIALGLRTTVIRTDAGLVVHSPIADADWSAVAALGQVAAIVAPNKLHHLGVASAKAQFPNALLLGVPGLAEKRRDLRFDGLAHEHDFGPQLEAIQLAGMPGLEEVALLHSGTLILCDFLFHFPVATGWTKLYLKMNGALGKPAQTKLLRSYVEDRRATREAVDRVLARDFERIVVAHGSPITEHAKEGLREATAYLT